MACAALWPAAGSALLGVTWSLLWSLLKTNSHRELAGPSEAGYGPQLAKGLESGPAFSNTRHTAHAPQRVSA